MDRSIRILLVDDDPADRALARRTLSNGLGEVVIEEADSRSSLLSTLDAATYDVVVTDHALRGLTGLEVIDIVREGSVDTPIIMLTGTGTEEVAIEAMKRGVSDYVIKTDQHIKRLPSTVEHVLQSAQTVRAKQRTEEALRDSEERLRALSDATFEAIFLSEEGICLDQSATAEKMFGYSSAEAIGRPGTDWIVPEDRELVESNMLAGYEGLYEATALRKDGTTFPAEIQARMVDYQGRLVRVTALRDITERKRAEEALRESEERFRSIFENSLIGMYRTTPDGRTLTANPALVRMLGYSSVDELEQRNLERRGYAPEYRRSGFTRQIEAEGVIIGLEAAWTRRDGGTLFVRESARAIRDEANKTLYYEGTVEDVTERRRAEERLRQSERDYRQLFESAHDPILVFDPNDETILEANRRACEVYGFGKEELIGKTLGAIQPAERRGRERTDEILSQAPSHGAELVHRRKDGSPIHVAVNAALVTHKGREAVLSINRDVTERKRAEETLRESERRSRAIFDQTFQFIGLMTLDGTLIEANRTALSFAGIEESDVLGRPFWETPWWTHSPELQDRLREAVREAAAGRFVRFEATHPAADGAHHSIDFSLKPVTDESGNVALLIPEGRDITERKQAEEAINQRERYLAGLSDAAQALLIPVDTVPFQDFLDKIGPASDAGRTYVFMNHRGPDGAKLMSQVAEWCAEGINPEIDNPKLQNLSYDEFFPRWRDALSRGEIINGRVADFPDEEREILEPQDIQAILIIPIMVGNELVGFIGFDNCASEREWDEVEQTFLLTAANDLAQAVRRKRAERELSRHREHLEELVKERTAELQGEITERKRREADLRESEQRFRLVAQTTSDLIYEWDVASDRLDWFGDIDAALGLAPGALPRTLTAWVERIHPDDQERLAGSIQRHRESTEPIYEEYRIQGQDGTWRHWVDCGAPVLNGVGRPHKWIGACLDITDRRRAEDALRDSEERYRTVVEFASECIYWRSPEGSVLYVSPACVELTGYTAEEFEASPELFDTVVHPDDRALWENHCPAPRADGSHEPLELRIVTKHGQVRWISHVCRPVHDDAGEFLGVRGSNRDVTERKRAEERAQRHLTELAHAGRVSIMGEMAAGLAHEINQPLGAIVGYTDACVALMQTGTATPEELCGELEKVSAQAIRAGKIIHRLRNFVRKGELSRSTVAINDLVREVANLVRADVRSSGVALEIALGNGLPMLYCDSIQIQQVILNLIQNARDALREMQKGARCLTIRTALAADDAVEITVSDNGPGLPAEAGERVFDPFSTTKPNGTGLGLSISRSIVEAHGGRLWATPNPDQGVTFWIHLPLTGHGDDDEPGRDSVHRG